MTIKDIARLSGVGVSTVSRALNGHPDISAETREKIQRVVDEYGFVPNSNAQLLKRSENKTIAVVVKGRYNLFFVSIIEKIQNLLDETSRTAAVHYIGEYDDEGKYAQRVINESKPQGVIILGGNSSAKTELFAEIKTPCVLCTVDGSGISWKNISSVSVDDTDGGRRACELLIKYGHRRIGILSADFERSLPCNSRYKGCLEALDEYHLSHNLLSIERCDFSVSSAYEAGRRLIEKNRDITGIFAMSDIMAIGCMKAVYDSGKKVGRDISVIGFDGIELGRYVTPALATIKQPEEKLAEQSVRLLIGMLDEGVTARHIRLRCETILGGSLAPKNESVSL